MSTHTNKEDYDNPFDTLEELEKIVQAQENSEKEKLFGYPTEIEQSDRLIQQIEAHEQSVHNQRILDELHDKKEEDGGSYR